MSFYKGIEGITRKIKKLYNGVNDVARQFHSSHSHNYISNNDYAFDDTVSDTEHFYTKTCSCGETTTVYEEHSFNWRVTTEVTCAEDGEEVYECNLCSKVDRTEVITATGHTEVTIDGYDATCTTDGMTDGSYCSVRNEILVAQTTIPATGHKTDSTNAKEPTCTEEGYTGDGVCTKCGEEVSESTAIPALGIICGLLPVGCLLSGALGDFKGINHDGWYDSISATYFANSNSCMISALALCAFFLFYIVR